MELTKEQMEYVMKYQRNTRNAEEMAKIVRKLAERYPNNAELGITPEELSNILLISNIGEHHPDMAPNGISIYSPEYGAWGQEERTLNSNRGSKSVEMAQSIGIELTPEMIESIEATSKGKSINLMALLMKAAQTYKAVQQPRWSRGVQKEAAKNFEEVEEILREELEFMIKGQEMDSKSKEQLIDGIVESTKATYSIEKVTKKAKSMVWNTVKYMQEFTGEQVEITPMETDEFWNEFFSDLTNEQVAQVMNEVEAVYDIKEGMVSLSYPASKWYSGLESIVNKYKNPFKAAVLKTTCDVPEKDALDIIDGMNPDKNKQEEH